MISEIWSTEYSEIESFILNSGGEKIAEGKYGYKGALITVTKLANKSLGHLSFPQNQIEISGDIADAEEFHKAFKLKYLKAGG